MKKKRELKKQLSSLEKSNTGFTLIPTKHRGVVLSGGGSKGIAYLGMIKAMQEQNFLEQIEYVSGASAGAMTASIIAFSPNYDDCTKMIAKLELHPLLDSEGVLRRAKGVRMRNMFELFYMVQMKALLATITKPISDVDLANYLLLEKKLNSYEQALFVQGLKITSCDDILNLGQSINDLEKMDLAFAELPKIQYDENHHKIESPRIAFADLPRLRSLLAEEKKHLIKNLSVVTTNQSKGQLEIFSETHSPNDSIAEKVIQSGTHPVLFIPNRNEEGELIADGGILDNMPTQALREAGLHKEEILCVRAQTGSEIEKEKEYAADTIPELVTQITKLLDYVSVFIFGGRVFEGITYIRNREKVFFHLGNMLYLDAGTITTTTISPTEEQKTYAVEAGYHQTKAFINSHVKAYDNALIAMIHLGEEKLKGILLSDEYSEDLFYGSGLAKGIFLLQNALSEEINNNDFQGLADYLKQIEQLIKSYPGLTVSQQKGIMSLCVKQVDFYTNGLLRLYVMQQIREEEERFNPSLYSELLNFFSKAINWFLALFSKLTNVENDMKIEKEEPFIEKENTPMLSHRILNLFSYKYQEEKEPQSVEFSTKSMSFA